MEPLKIPKAESKTSFLILSAGNSSRMKADKALLDYHGEPWLRHQIREIQSSDIVDQVIIVDQPGKKEIYQKILMDFEHIRFIENNDPQSAQAESILLGWKNVPCPEGSFLSPIDVPLKSEILRSLFQNRRAESVVVKPSYQNRGGHPVWIRADGIAAFLEKPQRLDFFINDLPSDRVEFMEFRDQWPVLNFNHPEDWQKFVKDFPQNLKN